MKKRWQALKQRFLTSKFVRFLNHWSKRIILPGFAGMSLFAVLKFIVESFQKTSYGIRSSAIAFKFFLAIFPGILFFVSIIPFIPIDNFQENLLEQISLVTPTNVYAVIDSTIDDLVTNKNHLVLGLGVFLTLFYASNGINAMLSVFNSSHQIEMKRNPLKQRVLALGIFAAMAIFMIIGLAALTYGEIMVNSVTYKNWGVFLKFVFQLIKWIVMLISMMIAVGTLFNLGNPQIKSTKWLSPGSSLATVSILMVSYLMSFFFSNFSSYNELYGSIGSLMMVLIWLNAVSYVLIIGFELHTLGDFQRKKLEQEATLVQ